MNPIPLIKFDQNSFSLTSEAREFLSSLDEPLGVITIVGKYRTGKSLFLNKILLNKNQQDKENQSKSQDGSNFKVCPTINSCTKGLWISKQTISSQHPQHEGMKVLVIDTEGFGAVEESDSYGNNILLLALLLSSYFIYNSVGSIDEKSLNNLNVITNLAKELQSKNMNNDKLEQEFPTFMWVVRDFTLKMVDNNGFQIDSKEYLEQALKIRKGVSDAIQSKNKIRRMIQHFFKDRDCSTLVTPVLHEQQLQKLNSLPDSQFRPQFLEQITALRQKIVRRIKPKKLKNKIITGVMLIQIADKFTQAINNGSLPNLESTWKHVANFEIKRSVGIIQKSIETKVNNFLNIVHEEGQIDLFQKHLLDDTLDMCKKLISFESQATENYEKLKNQIQRKMLDIRKQNKKKSMNELLQIYNQSGLQHQDSGQQSVQQFYNQMLKIKNNFLKNHSYNPSLHCFLSENFYPLSLQNLYYRAKYLQKSLGKSELTCKNIKQQFQKILQQKDDKICTAIRDLESAQQEVSVMKIKLTQHQKIKELQIGYLNKQISQNREDIQVLLSKLQKTEESLTEYRQGHYQAKIQQGSIQQINQQLENNMQFLKKQVQILQNTIKSKQQELSGQREKILQLEFELERSYERQKNLSNRSRAEIQSKSTDYEIMMNKYTQSQSQIRRVSQKLARVQTKLEQQRIQHLQEKSLCDNYLLTMKNSLETQAKQKNQLMQTNRNMGFALKNLEQRFQHIEEKQKKLKQFKRCIKNSSCLQCINCSKFFVPSIFSQHLNICVIGPDSMVTLQQCQKKEFQEIDIKVIQTLLKDSDSKPYTQYVLSIRKAHKQWKIQRKYKSFCDLHSQLKTQFPGLSLSESSFIVNPQEGTKKSLLVEERKKILERYLKDLCKNPLIVNSYAWRSFIGDEPDAQPILIQSPNKMVLRQLMKSNVISDYGSPDKQNEKICSKNVYKSPQQFLKVWNERNIRVKEVAKNNKNK